MSKHSRSWLVKRINRLLMPGFTRVEFADFWMGDQFCSLVFTLSNLPLLVCTYAKGFDPGWHGECGNKAAIWPAAFVLAQLPLFIRFVQSVRRYADSGLNTHLINGGKYASGIVSYLFYYLWRHHGGRGTFFALWILFNTIYALYAGTWDLLMDWSLMKPRAKHRFLRDDLLYTNYVWLYYVTIVLNIILRFAWVIYIPALGPDNYLRSFIVGTIEVFRRVLWNFYRLENEHLGNVDQYRVTREVPLPYSLEESRELSDDEDDEDKRSAKDSK
ncbi:EXS-domain-containing protein [Cylindrobasidium torrendii FP15055 ss-10]|uniref:EXS-domain-containing protein n=1 Tax=Cylindrobasidium torrendii FP15055 ss-10 TaxID=1314674 RepID=A0A0D7BKR5_9AGAR|nr:EXS-domain-containing protein [Cylindrobasidium torrendii FP15055 ss-10]